MISKSLQSYDDDGVVSVTCWPTPVNASAYALLEPDSLPEPYL